MNSKGSKGAFQREACQSGCPLIITEKGKVWKVEPEKFQGELAEQVSEELASTMTISIDIYSVSDC